MRIAFWGAIAAFSSLALLADNAAAQQRCEIPREAHDIWRCDHGFVIGPESVIIRLPIPETDPEALYNAGVEAADRQDWRVAIAYFAAAQRSAHLVPKYMYNLGLAHARAGHEPAAIAWLVTYLIAAPDAANRAAVWQEIAALEASNRRKVDAIYSSAEAAVLLLPNAPESGNPVGIRYRIYRQLASSAASGRDLSRASHFLELANRSALATPGPGWQPDWRPIDAAVWAALEDDDLAFAQQSGMPTNPSPDYAGRLLRGLISQDLCQPWSSAYRHALCPEPLNRGVYHEDFAVYLAAQSGSREALRAVLSRSTEDRWQPARQAADGNMNAALQLLRQNQQEQFLGRARDFNASIAADVMLRTGSADEAEPLVRLFEQMAAEDQRSRPESAEILNGLVATARALSMTERGQAEEAITLLEIAQSRTLVEGQEVLTRLSGNSPPAYWMARRFDGRVAIAEYLIDRGREQQALQVMASLDSLRQRRVAEYAQARGTAPAYAALEQAALARATNGGPAMSVEQQRMVEDAIVVATTIPGIGNDPQWWFASMGTSAGRANRDATARASNFGIGAAGLQRGVIRMQAIYRRAGGVWMDPAPATPQADMRMMAFCPDNLVSRRGNSAPLTCECPPRTAFLSVWGNASGYTDDSDICRAAMHAGAITEEAGGRVTVTPQPGLSNYPDSYDNRVNTSRSGPWGGSFTVAPAQ